ncbi:MAG: YCF48-related protein [bacterium]
MKNALYSSCCFATILLVVAGCSIRLSSNQVHDGGIFASSNYGESWQHKVFVSQQKKQTITISNTDIGRIILSPHQQKELTITTIANGIYTTTDGGEHWKPTVLNAGYYPAFAYDPGNEAIRYATTGRNILKSANSGSTWQVIYTDTRGEQINAIGVDRYDTSRILAGTNGGTVLKSVNYGNDWSVKYTAGDPIRDIFFRSDDTRIVYLLTTKKGLVRSSDGGETWSSLEAALQPFPGAATISQVAFTTAAPKTFYIATNYGLLKSDDGGDTWSAIQTLIPATTVPIHTVGIDPKDPRILYFTVNNLLHKSEDGGKTWRTNYAIGTTRLINTLLVHPTESGLLYLGTFKVKR